MIVLPPKYDKIENVNPNLKRLHIRHNNEEYSLSTHLET
jgi:hypothetical protein